MGVCQQCGKDLARKEREKKVEFDRRRFCDRDCSLSHTNDNKIRKIPKEIACDYCGVVFSGKRSKSCSRDCGVKSRTLRSKAERKFLVKGDLFRDRGSWQSARSTIQKDAREVYVDSGNPMACLICGYTNHVEVCHIVGVSEFPDSSLLGEINDPNNLVGLCPNHHWEMDNGLLTLGKN